MSDFMQPTDGGARGVTRFTPAAAELLRRHPYKDRGDDSRRFAEAAARMYLDVSGDPAIGIMPLEIAPGAYLRMIASWPEGESSGTTYVLTEREYLESMLPYAERCGPGGGVGGPDRLDADELRAYLRITADED